MNCPLFQTATLRGKREGPLPIPPPNRCGWPGVENTHPGGDISIVPNPGRFYSGLTALPRVYCLSGAKNSGIPPSVGAITMLFWPSPILPSISK